MATQKDFTHLIERLDAFEERLGVSIESLRAGDHTNMWGGINGIVIFGQLHPREGTQIGEDVNIIAEAYERSGRIIEMDKHTIYQNNFFGFETFKIVLLLDSTEVSKIRIYPKRC